MGYIKKLGADVKDEKTERGEEIILGRLKKHRG